MEQISIFKIIFLLVVFSRDAFQYAILRTLYKRKTDVCKNLHCDLPTWPYKDCHLFDGKNKRLDETMGIFRNCCAVYQCMNNADGTRVFYIGIAVDLTKQRKMQLQNITTTRSPKTTTTSTTTTSKRTNAKADDNDDDDESDSSEQLVKTTTPRFQQKGRRIKVESDETGTEEPETEEPETEESEITTDIPTSLQEELPDSTPTDKSEEQVITEVPTYDDLPDESETISMITSTISSSTARKSTSKTQILSTTAKPSTTKVPLKPLTTTKAQASQANLKKITTVSSYKRTTTPGVRIHSQPLLSSSSQSSQLRCTYLITTKEGRKTCVTVLADAN